MAVAIRQRKASGLIIANFMVRNVQQNAEAIHAAKISIQHAVDCVYAQLPNDIEMRLHLCKANGCHELVIRDTEGFCSRHRAQKYHKKSQNPINDNNNDNNNNNNNIDKNDDNTIIKKDKTMKKNIDKLDDVDKKQIKSQSPSFSHNSTVSLSDPFFFLLALFFKNNYFDIYRQIFLHQL